MEVEKGIRMEYRAKVDSIGQGQLKSGGKEGVVDFHSFDCLL